MVKRHINLTNYAYGKQQNAMYVLNLLMTTLHLPYNVAILTLTSCT